MDNITLLVLANPTDRQLAMLEKLPNSTSIVVGNSVEAFQKAAPEAEAIFYWSGPGKVLEQIWPLAKRVKWVHCRNAGLDNLLFPGLVESPVPMTNGRGVFSQSLGEFVIGAALYFVKDFRRLIRNQDAGRWEHFDVDELRGQTMCIVGYGDIGRACAQRAHAMGMRVLAVRRRPELSQGDSHISGVYSMEQMIGILPQSDFVVAAAPLAPGTRHLIGEVALGAMKNTAVVMNVGRGPVVDEVALIRALQSGRIRGAALDVFEVEPLPTDSPLWKLENVLLSPHSTDHTKTWLEDAMQFFIDNFERYAAGQPLVNVVDKRAGY
jgi:phosphoglycerate dehydrogenase-like enzyme